VSFDKTVFIMAVIRLVYAGLMLAAGLLMLRYNTVAQALRINGVLGLMGPFILITVSVLGIADMAGKVSLSKLLVIITGVILIMYGTSK